MKKDLALLLVIIFVGTTFVFAQGDKTTTIKGTIEQIAEDSSCVVVSGNKILTTKELVEEAYFDLGDKVEIKAESSPEGLRMVSYKYDYDYDEDSEYDDDDGVIYSDEDSLD